MPLTIIKSQQKLNIETATTRYVVHISSCGTEGKISLYQATFKKVGSTMNLHYHKKLTETFTILKGTFMFHVNGEEYTAEPFDSIVVSPMQIHGFRALETNSEMIISFSDSTNRDDFFVELAEWVNSGKKMNNNQFRAF